MEETIANLCDDRGLACYESDQELPAPADLTLLRHKDRHRRDHDPSETDKRDPGALDVVYGRFRFDADLLKRAVPAPALSIVVVADAWPIVQRTYDGSNPDAFLERRFPRGVQAFVLSLAGRPQNGTISKSECDRAVRHLDSFSLVADDIKVVTTALYGLYDVEAPAAPPPPKTTLRASAAAKARVLDASRCHARVVAAARALPTFFSPS